MKKVFLFIATLIAVVACTTPVTPFQPTLEVVGPETTQVDAIGGEIKFTVKANVAYTVSSKVAFVEVTPETVPAKNNETVETEVTVKVGTNETDVVRNFSVEIKTVDYAPLDRTVELSQAAAEVEKDIQLLDKELKPFEGPIALESHETAEIELVVNSTVSWAIQTNVSWITVTPNSAVIEGYVWTPTTIKIAVEENDGDERSGRVVIEPAQGSGLASIDLLVSQVAKPADPLTVDVKMISVSEYAGQAIPQYPDATCRITILENPSKTVTAGYYGVWQSAAWEQSELDDPMELLLQYGNAMEADELAGLNGAEGADPCELVWSKLLPGTEYVLVAGFVAADGDVYTAYSKSTTDKEEDPGEADAAYTKWIGTYNFTVNGKTHVATISENVVNKSFIVDLSGADNSYIEDFAPVADWDKDSDKVTIAEQTMGQWTHPSYGTIVDHVYGMISYNGGHPLITGNGYSIASLSYNSGNVVIESAGTININGLGEMPLVGMSLFGVASAGNMRYCDEADFMLFPVTLTKATNAPAAVKSGKASLETSRKTFGAKKAVKVSNFVELR